VHLRRAAADRKTLRHDLPEDFSVDGAVEAASRGLRHLRVA
jgi:hypothetical protein